MSRWQQLGEVPDSEDEDGSSSLDGEVILDATGHLTSDREDDTSTTTSSPEEARDDSIWDIPGSSQEDALLPNLPAPINTDGEPSNSVTELISLESSPLSSAKSDDELPPVNPIDFEATTIQSSSSEELSSISSRSTSQLREPRGSISKLSSVLGRTESEDELQGSSPPRKKQKTSLPPSRALGRDPDNDNSQGTAQAASRPNFQAEEQLEARRVSVRNERSLRPRKPIQEHPYLLENAQYASVFKQHGVKPLRMALLDERQRQRRQQAEQEEDDDFQDESQGSGQPLHDFDSQIKDLDDIIEELNNVESSSLPKTSPGIRQIDPSSQTSSRSGTDDTSVAEDDLPDLRDLLSKPVQLSKAKRRRALPLKQKADAHPTLRIPPPIRTTSPIVEDPSARSPNKADVDFDNGWVAPFLDGGSDEERTPVAPHQAAPAVVIPDDTSSSGSEDEDSESDSSTKSTHEAENKAFGKRIRGVLPASWLRLDQQSAPNVARNGGRQHRGLTPEREQRKGVAQRRYAIASADISADFFEESDDEPLPRPEQPTTDDAYSKQTRLSLQPTNETAEGFQIFTDDEGSVVEEDRIDRMFSGPKKRQLDISDSFQRSLKKPKKRSTERRLPKDVSSQRRIDSIFRGHKVSGSKRPGNSTSKSTQASKANRSAAKQPRPKGQGTPKQLRAPQLSILDVIDSDAPQFLKIAARSAKRRVHQGRASPTRKSINLATRADHVDAVTVLNRWKAGSITPRLSVTADMRKQTSKRRPAGPLAERSANAGSASRRHAQQASQLPTTRHLKKTTSDGGSVSFKGDNLYAHGATPKTTMRAAAGALKTQTTPSRYRPAQLETDEGQRDRSTAFHNRKRLLDRLYRNRDYSPSVPSVAGTVGDVPETRKPQIRPTSTQPPSKETKAAGIQLPRRRMRKQARPRQVDLEAPEYSHSKDPLPVEALPVTCPGIAQPRLEGDKLTGLGPYGTHYTHHFEVFPLRVGVFFHSSTLIGGGVLEKVAGLNFNVFRSEIRPTASFTLGEQPLRWNSWNSQVSSEVGVVVDFIADQLDIHLEGSTKIDHDKVVGAASFILDYIKDTLSFQHDGDEKASVARLLEVLSGFDKRMNTTIRRTTMENASKMELLAKVYDRVILAAAVLWQVSSGTSSLFTEQMQLETLLQNLSKTAVSGLMILGPRHLRATYDELLSEAARERGIREDKTSIHSWFLIMKVLEMANIPRSTFWDVLQSVIMPTDLGSNTDVTRFEDVWRNFFTMVPLTEFTSSGVLNAGSRHDRVADGWTVPLQLLKRVFQLYQDNSRQEASFNSYCRALIARCHYLVQQWGWKKCVGVVGVIFDFFGSQGLSHLRNEEVYQSPRFLEQLSAEPALDVQPEDKPFHIFLKLLALSLRSLAEDGLVKDVRNLVARTMPNHDRQHLKEQDIRQRDLAALRNHHDLLVTLYWASTPETRPNPTLIERLVSPANSHKEACLINLRAWSQLARYVVASGEAGTSFRPFRDWRNGFFLQVLQQYDSVESDLQQQFMALAKDDRQNISKALREACVKKNKETVGDILYLSTAASLDVMTHAPDLEAAVICFDPRQLKHVFRHFAVVPAELDRSILLAALKILNGLMGRISDFKDGGDSQQSESQLMNALALADDSLLQVDRELANDFFSMARSIISGRSDTGLPAVNKQECEKLTILISARLGHKMIEAGSLRIVDMFKTAKYGLFENLPAELQLKQRKWLALFVSSLLEQGLSDFAGDGLSLLEIWVLALVKPAHALAFENQLALQLFKSGATFVPEAVVGLGLSPGYGTNRAMFEFVLGTMRKQMREAAPSKQRQVKAHIGGVLQLAMDQIKRDLSALSSNSHEHLGFVRFVHEIISLVRSQAADFARIDDFFYQISRDYSPPVQDPQLQVAGMQAYALKLSEGDESAAYQLFYYLLNNLKAAVMAGSVMDQVDMLQKGMENPAIYRFVIGHMLPSTLRAYDSASPQLQTWEKDCFTLILCVLRHALTARHGAQYFQSSLKSDDAEAWYNLIIAVAAHSQNMIKPLARHVAGNRGRGVAHVPVERQSALGEREAAYCFRNIRTAMVFIDLGYPALRASMLEDAGHGTALKEHLSRLEQAMVDVHRTLRLVYDVLGDAGQPSSSTQPPISPPALGTLESKLADSLLDDIGKNWTSANGMVTVCSPNKPTVSSGSALPGTKWPLPLGTCEEEKASFVKSWNNLSHWYRSCYGREQKALPGIADEGGEAGELEMVYF